MSLLFVSFIRDPQSQLFRQKIQCRDAPKMYTIRLFVLRTRTQENCLAFYLSLLPQLARMHRLLYSVSDFYEYISRVSFNLSFQSVLS